MSDGAGITAGPGGQSGEQQPQNPAVPGQATPPASPFPAHVQPQQPPAGQQPMPPQQPGGFPPQATQQPPGHGYPSGQPSYGYPPQGGGYGYPPQGGYGYPPLAQPGEPDWAELAEQNETATRRRKRLLMISGGVLAVAAVAGIVTTTLLLSGKDKNDKPVANPTASTSATAAPGDDAPGPAPTSPEGFLNRLKTDKAPLTPQTLFADTKVSEGNRQYNLVATDVTTTANDCSAGLDPDLAKIAKVFGCLHVFRATYLNGATAVTLAIADFPDSDSADKTAKAAASMTVNALVDGGNAPKFCQGDTACRSSRTSVGRYYVSTVAGRADGNSATAADKLVPVAARDLANYGSKVLIARGKAAMAAAGGGQAPAAGSPSPTASPTG
ncbi:flagellar basal body-associated FliL family protein [Kitasatospora sp. NPDC001175]|uniref:hypothetical protein n=1 Tax=Kitasatospora sp. NPDC001175 TaxID=3157103 RepID=UPI003D0695A8